MISAKRVFSGAIVPFDEQEVREDGTLFCKFHQMSYKAEKLETTFIKKWKNCPRCNAETNYRIALKDYYDTIAENKYFMAKGEATNPLMPKPQMPEWWVSFSEKSEYYPSAIITPNKERIKAEEIYADAYAKNFTDTLGEDVEYPF